MTQRRLPAHVLVLVVLASIVLAAGKGRAAPADHNLWQSNSGKTTFTLTNEKSENGKRLWKLTGPNAEDYVQPFWEDGNADGVITLKTITSFSMERVEFNLHADKAVVSGAKSARQPGHGSDATTHRRSQARTVTTTRGRATGQKAAPKSHGARQAPRPISMLPCSPSGPLDTHDNERRT